ncbi:MAG: Uma2 family endonuclease [Cyanobacteriota bacterium]|nr:Uma2 family endonuclease [Cyanobacteriota bacterium]
MIAQSSTTATPSQPPFKKLTFEEYRVYRGEPDVLYELEKGQLIPMPSPSILHERICEFLVYKLQRYLTAEQIPLVTKTNLGVRTEEDSSRIPDVVVCTQNLWETVAQRPGSGILDLEETPRVIIEVVGEDRRRDYVIKRAEYEQAGVPEYWIADAKENKRRVRAFALVEGEEGYVQRDYGEGENIVSVQFPNLVLSVKEILNPPLVDELIRVEQNQLQQLQQLQQQLIEERDRATRLAARLRELNLDPDTL